MEILGLFGEIVAQALDSPIRYRDPLFIFKRKPHEIGRSVENLEEKSNNFYEVFSCRIFKIMNHSSKAF